MDIGGNYKRWLYALVVLLVIIAGLYLLTWAYGALRASSTILGLYFSAWMLQFLFTPVVDFLTRRRLPRLLAVLYVYLVLAFAIGIAIVAVAPGIYNQGEALAGKLGDQNTYQVIPNVANNVEHFLEQHGVPRKLIGQFTHDYSVNLRAGVSTIGLKIGELLSSHLTASNIGNSAAAALSVFNTITSFLVDVILVLILAFYMTLDGHRLMLRLLTYFPPVVGEIMASVQGIVNRKFGGYLRGQFILAASYGVLTYAIATAFSLRYQIFIAIFAAIMMLIPFVGTFAAIVPPIIAFVLVHVATPTPSFPVGEFLLLLAFLVGSQQLVLNVLAPRVMGSAVGMHPLLVVLGLLLGIQVAGLWGAIFGVPVFGVILETADLIYRRVMDRRFGFHPPSADELAAGGTAGYGAGAMSNSPGGSVGATSGPSAPQSDAAPLPRAGVTLQPPSAHDTRT